MKNVNAQIHIDKSLKWILALLVLGIVLMFLFKIGLNKYSNFLPSFGSSDEDKVINNFAEWVGSLKGKDVCCCFYDGTRNTGNCQVAEVEDGKYCKDVLMMGWVDVDSRFCISEQICQYNYDDDKDGQIDCADGDCDGKSCGSESFCAGGVCKKK